MNLITLFKKESTVPGTSTLFMAIASGTAQGLLLGIITTAAATATYESLNFKYFLLFLITFAIVIIGKRFALKKATAIAEAIVKRMRIRIVDKIRKSELLFLENIGKSEIYTKITYNTNLISESAVLIINAAQSGIVLFFCMFYIAYLSKLAFFITILAIGIAVVNYLAQQGKIDKELRAATEQESIFFDMLNQTLEGFKELKMNKKKNDDLFEALEDIADETEDMKVKTGFRFVTELMFSQIFFYTLLAIIVFILPRLDPANPALIIRLTAAILFIIGPVNLMVGAIPLLSRANMAVEILFEFEKRLDEANRPFKVDGPAHVRKIKTFNKLGMENLSFSYTDNDKNALFTVGPVNLSIQKEEILFIVGGNGSGKSTLLKLLTGLYYPETGAIRLDDMKIDKTSYQPYREMFSIIFSDFHLFNKLYGLTDIDIDKTQNLIELMELERKTEIIDGAFTNINLSTGQRKRLAMICTLLEDRPILIFDEWAADQDPNFSKYFYEVLLKDLRAQGKTIIAVSHDDRYFGFADRVLKMEYGKFVEHRNQV